MSDATDKLLPQLKMPVLIVWGALDQIRVRLPPSRRSVEELMFKRSRICFLKTNKRW